MELNQHMQALSAASATTTGMAGMGGGAGPSDLMPAAATTAVGMTRGPYDLPHDLMALLVDCKMKMAGVMG